MKNEDRLRFIGCFDVRMSQHFLQSRVSVEDVNRTPDHCESGLFYSLLLFLLLLHEVIHVEHESRLQPSAQRKWHIGYTVFKDVHRVVNFNSVGQICVVWHSCCRRAADETSRLAMRSLLERAAQLYLSSKFKKRKKDYQYLKKNNSVIKEFE